MADVHPVSLRGEPSHVEQVDDEDGGKVLCGGDAVWLRGGVTRCGYAVWLRGVVTRGPCGGHAEGAAEPGLRELASRLFIGYAPPPHLQLVVLRGASEPRLHELAQSGQHAVGAQLLARGPPRARYRVQRRACVQLALLRGVAEQTGEQTDRADLRRVVTRRVVLRRWLHRVFTQGGYTGWLHRVVTQGGYACGFHTLTSASFDSVCSLAVVTQGGYAQGGYASISHLDERLFRLGVLSRHRVHARGDLLEKDGRLLLRRHDGLMGARVRVRVRGDGDGEGEG